MAGRSYLRRIAQPLAPGDARLMPVRAPLLGEARPPVADAAPWPAESFDRTAPSPVSPGCQTHPAAARVGAPPDDAGEREETGLAIDPRADDPVLPSARDAARPQPVGPSRAPLPPVEPGWCEGPHDVAPLRRPAARRAEVASERPALHIGTIEVRMHPAPSPPAPPAAQPAPSAQPAGTPSAPLARGLAWRYGFAQG
jgi:hypothetical protein